MELQVKKLNDKAIMPKRATSTSAGLDLFSIDNLVIEPHEIVKIHTGISVSPTISEVALCIFPRSGLATKHGISLVNSVGLVDSDYRGEIIIPLINHSNEPYVINYGERVAQLVEMPIYLTDVVEVDSLDTTERGNGGFGSTGV